MITEQRRPSERLISRVALVMCDQEMCLLVLIAEVKMNAPLSHAKPKRPRSTLNAIMMGGKKDPYILNARQVRRNPVAVSVV